MARSVRTVAAKTAMRRAAISTTSPDSAATATVPAEIDRSVTAQDATATARSAPSSLVATGRGLTVTAMAKSVSSSRAVIARTTTAMTAGRAAIATTAGNPDCHVILRGGAQPNFDAASVSAAAGVLQAQGRRAALMIDASHANSGKNPDNQPAVIDDIAGQIERGDRRIVGTMIESHLVAGKQALVPGAPLVYGQSITDGCIDWTTTEHVLDRLAIAVRARRARVDARAA